MKPLHDHIYRFFPPNLDTPKSKVASPVSGAYRAILARLHTPHELSRACTTVLFVTASSMLKDMIPEKNSKLNYIDYIILDVT